MKTQKTDHQLLPNLPDVLKKFKYFLEFYKNLEKFWTISIYRVFWKKFKLLKMLMVDLGKFQKHSGELNHSSTTQR